MSELKDPLYRYLTLLQLIPRWPHRISTPVLLEKLRERGFEITPRSLQRDLSVKLANFPIVPYTDEKPYRWGYSQHAWFDPGALPVPDTPAALALYLAESHLSNLLPQSVLDLLGRQFRNARDYLDGMQHNGLAHWARRVRSLPNGKTLLPAPLQPQVWEQVSTALVENRLLQVDYRSRSKGDAKPLRLHPAGLVSRHSIGYLIASVDGYDDLRQFALHRILEARALDTPARQHAGFDIDRYIADGAFAWRQSPGEVELIADVAPQIAWLLGETPLSRQQRLEALPGSDWQRLHARVPLDQETLWWIFALNDQIRVHAPQVWVEEIGRKLEKLRGMYAAPNACDTVCRTGVETGRQEQDATTTRESAPC
ncbi:WYL domain-containing protein [Pseudomonas stutzeri]|nr:WYL domain-containing protein [Stutzerimonas stutzeri]